MADIRPFQAYRHDPAKVRPQDVLTQPYDKITPAMQDRYYAAHPDNLIPLEKGRALPGDSASSNVYTRAHQALADWISRGILARDAQPSLYAYFQDFAIPGADTGTLRRKSFIALGRLQPYSAGVIHRHELTLTGPRQDRLELLRHTRAQTGLLFMLYEDPAFRLNRLLDQAARQPAAVHFTDEFGVTHSLWPVNDSLLLQKIVAEMAPRKIAIADGHHRYETALAFRDESLPAGAQPSSGNSDAPSEFAMMAFVNLSDPGLLILPTHRVVANLPAFDFGSLRRHSQDWFEWRPVPAAQDSGRALLEFREALAERGRRSPAVGVATQGAGFQLACLRSGADLSALLPDLSPGQRSLDVVLLHRLLLGKALGISADAVARESHITYERSAKTAVEAVHSGRAQIAFLLNPLPAETVFRMALADEVMPQKSTDFYPKMLSGLTIYRLEE